MRLARTRAHRETSDIAGDNHEHRIRGMIAPNLCALLLEAADFCAANLLDGVLYWHTPVLSRRELDAHLPLGTLPGIPHWTFIWSDAGRSKVAFINLVSTTGRPTAPQRMFAKKASFAGATWHECRTIDNFVATLKRIGVPMRGERKAA
jgi:hypothetical protein